MKLKKMKNIKFLYITFISIILFANSSNAQNFFDEAKKKYEEKNYEQTIKENLANSISQKLILRLAVN